MGATTASHRHQNAIRFASSSNAQSSVSIRYLEPQETLTDSVVLRVKGKRNKGVVYGISAVALSLLSLFGVDQTVNAVSHGPSGVQQKQHSLLAPDWKTLVSVAHAGQLGDTGEQTAQFNQALQTWIERIVLTLKDAPTSPQDKLLIHNLTAAMGGTSGISTPSEVHHISTDLYNYLVQKGLPTQGASDRQINGAMNDFQADFVNSTPALQNLSSAQKSNFETSVRKTLAQLEQQEGGLYNNAFGKDITGLLNPGFNGVTLKAFQHIQNEADAKKLFTQIVNNPKNLTRLSPQERQSFLKYGLQVLDSTDLPQPNLLPPIMLILVGVLGGAGLTILKRKEIFGLLTSQRELNNALRDTPLVVQKPRLVDEAEQVQIEALNIQIDEKAQEMAQTLQELSQENPAVHTLLNNYFGEPDRIPDATHLRTVAEQAVAKAMSRRQRMAQQPIKESTFLSSVLQKLDGNTSDILALYESSPTS